MAMRDRARSDLYLAQLRSQSVPNTPGFNGPLSARDGGWRPPPGQPLNRDPLSTAEEGDGEGVQYAVAVPRAFTEPKPFSLQPAPAKAAPAITSPKLTQQAGFSSSLTPPPPASPGVQQQRQEHVPAAPGERNYGDVQIPGSYASPLNSPGFAPQHNQQTGFDFGLDERLRR
jgi:hypothetical protein